MSENLGVIQRKVVSLSIGVSLVWMIVVRTSAARLKHT